MSTETKLMIREWLKMHQGDAEAVARWMKDSLRIGGIKACRAMVEEASK